MDKLKAFKIYMISDIKTKKQNHYISLVMLRLLSLSMNHNNFKQFHQYIISNTKISIIVMQGTFRDANIVEYESEIEQRKIIEK